MGQFPRKCKLRGPSRVTSRYPAGTLYISPGPNCENPAKSRLILLLTFHCDITFSHFLLHFSHFRRPKNLANKLAKLLTIFKQKIEPDGSHEKPTRTVQRSAFCRSRRELPNAYLFSKFGFDTAENKPFKVR